MLRTTLTTLDDPQGVPRPHFGNPSTERLQLPTQSEDDPVTADAVTDDRSQTAPRFISAWLLRRRSDYYHGGGGGGGVHLMPGGASETAALLPIV